MRLVLQQFDLTVNMDKTQKAQKRRNHGKVFKYFEKK